MSAEHQTTLFTFDLAVERDRIQQLAGQQLLFFLANAGYYAKETYGKVPIDYYEQDIRINNYGRPELWYGYQGLQERARDSYLRPVNDKSLPKWYRERAYYDIIWLDAIERYLLTARTGDVFADSSPSPFNVPLPERKERGFGWHSFVRLHQVVEVGNKKVLRSIPIRHYLAPLEQEELFRSLTGQSVKFDRLLGTVGLVHPHLGLGSIRQIIQTLYQLTPEERKIAIPQEDKNPVSSEEMDRHLETLQHWLVEIFYMMKDQSISELEIEKQFHGWEMAVKKLDRGENETAAVYAPGTSDCGGYGSGFKKRPGLITYAEGSGCQEIECPKCHWKPQNGEEEEKIINGEITCCPVCQWRPG